MKRRPWNDPAWVAPPLARGHGGARSVTLTVDYLCELPLWNVAWGELGLSRSLLNDLADWQDAFDAGFYQTKGWKSTAAAEAWEADAETLADRLRDELGGRYRLEVDLWPLEGAT